MADQFSITKFLGHVTSQNEFALANKFDVIIPVPPFLQSLNYGEQITLSCENAELPGVDIHQIEFRHYSFIQRIPARPAFSPITMVFYCTGKMNEKRFFDTWADNTISFNTGLVEYPRNNGSYADVKVNQYDMMGNMSYTVTLIDAYPISVSPIMLNWADDSVNKLQVTFAYKKWLSDSTTKKNISEGTSTAPVGAAPVNNTNNTPGSKITGGGGSFGGGGASGTY